MANVFFHQNKMDAANSLYAKVGRTKNHSLSFCQLFLVLFPKFFSISFQWDDDHIKCQCCLLGLIPEILFIHK